MIVQEQGLVLALPDALWSLKLPVTHWGDKRPEQFRQAQADTAETEREEMWRNAKAAHAFLLWAENVAESTRRMLAGLEALGYRLTDNDPED